jgi:hypothetical protein
VKENSPHIAKSAAGNTPWPWMGEKHDKFHEQPDFMLFDLRVRFRIQTLYLEHVIESL